MSPDSVDAAAELGVAHDDVHADADRESPAAPIDHYRELFRAAHGTRAAAADVHRLHVLPRRRREAEEVARAYLSQYFLSVIKHYEFAGTHFGKTKGYQAYERAPA